MKKIIALILFCLFAFSTTAVFAESPTIGYMNRETIISQSKRISAGAQELINFSNQMVADFEREKVGLSNSDLQVKAQAYQAQIDMHVQAAEEQLNINLRMASRTVAKKLGLSVVTVASVMVYGGRDITQDIIDTIDAVQD
ncbi:MAG: hypothetical protein WCP79_06355 [Bacillota bacterium]